MPVRYVRICTTRMCWPTHMHTCTRYRVVEIMRHAANAGDCHAQYFLGVRYSNGEGVDKSFDGAMFWYKRAVLMAEAQGEHKVHEEGLLNIGHLHLERAEYGLITNTV